MPTPSAQEIAWIEQHLHRFSDPLEPPERAMLNRLSAGLWTEFDQRFYEHERLEADLIDLGIGWEEAHLQALEKQGIRYQPGYEAYLYHPTVIANPEIRSWFSRSARELSRRLSNMEDG